MIQLMFTIATKEQSRLPSSKKIINFNQGCVEYESSCYKFNNSAKKLILSNINTTKWNMFSCLFSELELLL